MTGLGCGEPHRAVPPGGDHQIKLVPLRWWHLEDVAALERDIFNEDAWTAELFWSELAQRPLRHYLAAFRGDRIIGYAGLAVHGEESFVQTLGTAPDARGAGVGTRLLAALLRHAREQGAHRCDLEVRTDNAAARSVYQRFGFVDLGVRRRYYHPSGADAYVMSVSGIHTPSYGELLDVVERAFLR